MIATASTPVSLPPHALIRQIADGYNVSRCLHVVANLGVADALGESPATAADLAASVGADPGALGRVLRLLAAHGVFVIDGEMISHSPASRVLRDDHPQSIRAFVRMLGLPLQWSLFGSLEHAVRTGQAAVSELDPDGFWAYLASHPEEARIFNAAMTDKARASIAAILANYDFSGFASVADIGGGAGHLLRAVLEAVPEARGVLFDLPYVIEEARDLASSRLTLMAGDFFRDPLPRCDAYLLMDIIHDWPDQESAAILRAVRAAASPGAKILLIEYVVPDDPGPDWAKALDIRMLALFGGSQRTRAEFDALLRQEDFRLDRVIDTGDSLAIVEATAV